MIRRKHLARHKRVIVRAPCLLVELIKAKGWNPSMTLPYQSYASWKPFPEDFDEIRSWMYECFRTVISVHDNAFGQWGEPVQRLDIVPNSTLTAWMEEHVEGLFFIVRDSDDNYNVWFQREADAVLFDLTHR